VPQTPSQKNTANRIPVLVTRQAILDILPLSMAVIPWGILTGALAVQAGFSPLQAQLMSLFVFAGAAQLSCISLIVAGASFLSISASTFVISARHLLYSITFRQHVIELPFQWRVLIAFLLTDEMFAVSEAHTRKTGSFSAIYALISGITFYVIWNLSTLFGIVAGNFIENMESLGLDFAIVATFIAMTFAELRKYPVLVAIVLSGTIAVLLKPIITDSYIIVAALVGMFGAYIVDETLTTSDRRAEL